MRSSLISGGLAAALAGAIMMIVAASAPASAFTLSSPSLDQPLVSSNIQHVWWDRWGRWRPNRRWAWGPNRRWAGGWGWRPGYQAFVSRPWRRCWWTWRGRVCSW
jgi:hypothetical protein